jgi:hypothetical protein
MDDTINPKAIGGLARAASLSQEERREIAVKAALARWKNTSPDGMPEAVREGKLQIGDVFLDCYHLKDGRRLFHKRALARALGLKSAGGNAFMKTMGRKGIGSVMSDEMREKIDNPILFKPLRKDPAHGYEGTFVIDLCNVILDAHKQGRLTPSQHFLAVQAEIILRSSAKVGIIALIDEATGYIKDKRKEEYRELFKEFIRQECGQYAKEFPEQFIDLIYRLYNLRRNNFKRNHPQFFGHFIRRYIYSPLVNSHGAILEMLDEKNPVVYVNGGRRHKLFQFLSDELGLPALRAHIWQVVGIGNSVRSKEAFDRAFSNAFPQSGHQWELFDFESMSSDNAN